jgi:hypothetical protein
MKTNSSIAEIFAEFKWNAKDDPFCDVCDVDSSESFLRSALTGKDTLGQITAYAAAQLGTQFRMHAYSVFILWDRSGTIVTEAFKYNEEKFLVEFFHRYSKASPAMRGSDVTALCPTDRQVRAAREALQLDISTPLVKLSVPSDASDDALNGR